MKNVGIIGGTGYVAGELIRCLVHHPQVELDFIYSHSQPGKAVFEEHRDLFAHPELRFADSVNPEVDVLFLCSGHGHSKKFLDTHDVSSHTRIIDLGSDFRLAQDANVNGRKFVYGLPELNRTDIQAAQNIANPGCFATAIQLALLPLAMNNLIEDEVHVHAITGSTGAGKELKATSHFSWRNSNVSIYKPFGHQHLDEIRQSVFSLQEERRAINFLPMRGDFTRGIFASAYVNSGQPEHELLEMYQDFYADHPFTYAGTSSVDVKQVVNTNYCLLRVQHLEGKVLITSAIDNLLKGASGQAIQNMNLMFGWDEETGLQMKSTYF